MKVTPSPLPKAPGIYALVHGPSKSIYIGATLNLRQRASQWIQQLRTGTNLPNNFPAGTTLSDWQFRVTLTHEQLAGKVQAVELNRLIEKALETPGLTVLSKPAKVPPTRRASRRDAVLGRMGLRVLDAEGNAMTYDEAAVALGANPKAVRMRAASYKLQGFVDIPLWSLNPVLNPALYPSVDPQTPAK